jgi:putative PIN family toxin of toxin-antitoxin system
MTSLVLVIDTNVVLDLFVYEDPATVPLRLALADAQTRWLATDVMREELRRVLAYPQVIKRLEARALSADAVLAAFDARVHVADTAPKASYTCKDSDDQKFIDLAAAHRAVLLSKDKAVLSMAKRLAKLGVSVSRQWAPAATQTLQTIP